MPNYQPSQAGLKSYRASMKSRTSLKIQDAIRSLANEKKPVNVTSVAKRAGISTVTLYKYADLAMQIKTIRDKRAGAGPRTRHNTTSSQLELLNQGMEMRIKELEAENKHLRRRIEAQNGEIHELKMRLRKSI